jgi:hypothetical protein
VQPNLRCEAASPCQLDGKRSWKLVRITHMLVGMLRVNVIYRNIALRLCPRSLITWMFLFCCCWVILFGDKAALPMRSVFIV